MIDDSECWLELTELAGLMPVKRLPQLRAEAEGLAKIFSATRTTARDHES